MAVNLSPIWGAGAQLFDNSGNVLTGGKIYTYAAGTTTPATTYTSSSGITANSNPIILNSAGRVPYEIWLSDTVAYKFVLKDSNDTLIATYDNLVGINSNFIAYTAQQEIQTATAGQTVFNLTTMQYIPSTNNLSVFVDGVNQYGPGAQYAFVETDTDTVTFVSGLHVGASVKFTTASPVAGAVMNAENVAYDPPFTGAVGTNVEAKLAQTVSVKDFGAVGDGVTDDTQAIQDAIDYVTSVGGGKVIVTDGMKCLIDNNLTISTNVSLEGPHSFLGSPGNNYSAPYGSMGGTLIVNSTATITISSNASINGFLIYRKGMTFPTLDATSFAGTVITINGDDAAISHCLIMGFNKAIYSTGNQRQRINNLWIDCNNGIEITDCLDIPYINTCHAWPFATIEAVAAGTSPGSALRRSGIAYYLHNTVDWAKLTDCFAYGYYRGFQITEVNSCTLLSCSADNTSSGGVPTYPNSVGFLIGGQENRLIGCQAAAHNVGISMATNTGNANTVIGFNAWACGDHGILLTNGDLLISDSNFRSMSNGISIATSTARIIDGGGNRFESITGPEWNFAASSDTSKIQLNTFLSGKPDSFKVVDGTFVLPSIASTNALLLPANGDYFYITGTTNFGTLEYGWAGRIVTLVFEGSLSVFPGTGTQTSMRLSGGVTFNTSALSTLTLLHTGSQWVEIGRSA